MNQSHSYKDERSETVKVIVSDTSGKQPVAFGAGQTTGTGNVDRPQLHLFIHGRLRWLED